MDVNFDDIKKDMINGAKDIVTEQAKQDFVNWVDVTVMPNVRDVIDTYVDQVKADSDNETGWSKFRDKFFIPYLVQGALYLINASLKRIQTK